MNAIKSRFSRFLFTVCCSECSRKFSQFIEFVSNERCLLFNWEKFRFWWKGTGKILINDAEWKLKLASELNRRLTTCWSIVCVKIFPLAREVQVYSSIGPVAKKEHLILSFQCIAVFRRCFIPTFKVAIRRLLFLSSSLLWKRCRFKSLNAYCLVEHQRMASMKGRTWHAKVLAPFRTKKDSTSWFYNNMILKTVLVT